MRKAVVAVAVVVLAGCGGSSRLTKKQYEHRVQGVGTELRHATSKFAAAAGDLHALDTATASAQKALNHAADELDGLTPPKNASHDNDQLVRGLRAIGAEMGKVHKAAATGNRTLAQKAAQEIGSSPAIKDAEAAAKDLQKKGYDIGAFAG